MKSTSQLTILAALCSAFATQSFAGEIIKANNLYIQKSMGQYLSFVALDGVLGANWTWPAIGGALASIKDSQCDTMRRMVEGLSTSELTFKTSECRDARKLALNTVVFGASNWGFSVEIETAAALKAGENAFSIPTRTFNGANGRNSFNYCSAVFSTISGMEVQSSDLNRKGPFGRPMFSNAIEFRGGCTVGAAGQATLNVQPVIIAN